MGREKIRHQTFTEITGQNGFEIVLKCTNELLQPIKKDTTSESIKIPVNRKNKINLKSFENALLKAKNGKSSFTDLPIIPAIKTNKLRQNVLEQKENLKEQENANLLAKEVDLLKIDDDSDEEQDLAKFEGHLYKLTETKKLKKLYFRLLHRDLYYFKDEHEQEHKGMHNLSGLFVKEEKKANY